MILRYRLDILEKLGYSNWGMHIASAYQQHKFKIETREEDSSLINVFKTRNFKLLVDPIE